MHPVPSVLRIMLCRHLATASAGSVSVLLLPAALPLRLTPAVILRAALPGIARRSAAMVSLWGMSSVITAVRTGRRGIPAP